MFTMYNKLLHTLSFFILNPLYSFFVKKIQHWARKKQMIGRKRRRNDGASSLKSWSERGSENWRSLRFSKPLRLRRSLRGRLESLKNRKRRNRRWLRMWRKKLR